AAIVPFRSAPAQAAPPKKPKPSKPYPEFPLYAHATRRWAKGTAASSPPAAPTIRYASGRPHLGNGTPLDPRPVSKTPTGAAPGRKPRRRFPKIIGAHVCFRPSRSVETNVVGQRSEDMATGQLSSVVCHLRRAALLQDSGGMTDGQLLECFLTW